MAGEDIIRMSMGEVRRLAVVQKVLAGEMTQREAGLVLDLSERQVRRLVKAVRERGEIGIVHGNRGRPSNRRYSEAVRETALRCCRMVYRGFGPTLASEKLAEREGLVISRETVRQWLLAVGLWERKRKRGRHRQWRERKACFGEMVQLDGSHHAWLEDRGPELVLMGYIDDATGKVSGCFYDYEGTFPAMDSFKRYARKYGLPVSMYLDKHTTYKSTRALTIEEELAGVRQPMSQFERALNELGVRVIHAHSPQAKGRIERLFGTLQDRLVKEMRLRGISTRDEANAFLQEYLVTYNRRFQVTPANKADVHVKPGRGVNLDQYLCLKAKRAVRNDNTVAHNKQLYQITQSVRSRTVIVEERINGSIHINAGGTYLKYRRITQRPITPAKSKQPRPPRSSIPPATDHPWRTSPLKSVVRKQMYKQTTK